MYLDKYHQPIHPGSVVVYANDQGLQLAMVDGFSETTYGQSRLLVWDSSLKKFRGRYVMVSNLVATPHILPSEFLRRSLNPEDTGE